MAPLLRVDDVSKAYTRGPRVLHVLKDASLDVHPGQLVSVYGERGAGKTTLLRIAAQQRALVALAKVGADDAAEQRWSSLSGTAQTLVAIAHALVREPRLLVVDDPTGGLGIIDRERVIGLLRSAAEDAGLGVLMAVPDMPAMQHAHEVRSLSRGRLLAPAASPPGGGTVVEFPSGEQSA